MPEPILRDSVRFVRAFARAPRQVGAVLPSSRWLAAALGGGLQLAADDVVVEYGPGTGPITAALAPQLPRAENYLGIERDASFCQRLRQRFPQLAFEQGSVADVEAILSRRQLAGPRYIISGLPFASLPEKVQRAVVEGTARALRADGEFRTFQYVHAYHMAAAKRFRAAMAGHFAHFERSPAVMRNVPPAYVLAYSNRSGD